MAIESAEELFVVSSLDDSSSDGPRIQLQRKSDASIMRWVDGASIKEQLLVDQKWYLLLVTEDSPYEDVMRVLLLDEHLELLDGLLLGGAYANGVLEAFQIIGEREIEFSFVHSGPCRVSVRRAGQLRLPILKAGVRSIGWSVKRYLTIRIPHSKS